jgi:hypothetical protein
VVVSRKRRDRLGLGSKKRRSSTGKTGALQIVTTMIEAVQSDSKFITRVRF